MEKPNPSSFWKSHGSSKASSTSFDNEPTWNRTRNFCPAPWKKEWRLNRSKLDWLSSAKNVARSNELYPAPKLTLPVRASLKEILRLRRPGMLVLSGVRLTSSNKAVFSRRILLAFIRTISKTSPGLSTSSRMTTMLFVLVLPSTFTDST